MLSSQKTQLTQSITNALNALAQERGLLAGEFPIPHLERPKVADHGDIACNIALQIAKAWKSNPRELAQAILDHLNQFPEYGQLIASAEIAGPGFINFRLSLAAKSAVVELILRQGSRFGRRDSTGAPDPSLPKRAMIEFVSANPTGPLHVGHGRQAALGDALANLLDSQNTDVHREFYYNDAGVQIHNLALSVEARLQGLNPKSANWPKDAYNGEYIAEIAQSYQSSGHDLSDLEQIRQYSVAYLRKEQDIDLKTFGVQFDQFYLESSLYTDGSVEQIISDLQAVDKTYEAEGALWLKTTDRKSVV